MVFLFEHPAEVYKQTEIPLVHIYSGRGAFENEYIQQYFAPSLPPPWQLATGLLYHYWQCVEYAGRSTVALHETSQYPVAKMLCAENCHCHVCKNVLLMS